MKRWVTVGLVVAVGVTGFLLCEAGAAEDAAPEGRRQTSTAVRATAQGGSAETGAVEGAPPALEVSLETRVAPGSVASPGRAEAARPAAPKTSEASLRLLSAGEGEATVELSGQTWVVRPGSPLGEGTVKAVGPGRLVYTRPALAGEPGDEALVVVTFDEAGRPRPRVFWSRDPEAPSAEVKRP